MFHQFDTEVAEHFKDTNIATIFQNLCYWIAHNKANERNKKKVEINGVIVDRYFTFNSISAFAQQFPYFSRRQIDTYISKLKEHGYIVKANYNDKGFDHTSWYCLVDEDYWMNKYLGTRHTQAIPSTSPESASPPVTNKEPEQNTTQERDLNTHEESALEVVPESPEKLQSFHFTERGNRIHQNVKSNSPKCEIEFTEQGNRIHQNVKPIPDINPSLKPKFKPNTAASVRNILCTIDPTLILDDEFYPAAADFLNAHELEENYLRWFYALLRDSKQIRNIHGYFFKVFFRDVYVSRFKAIPQVQQVPEKTSGHTQTCPVCGEQYEVSVVIDACPNRRTPAKSTPEELSRCTALFAMDADTRELYNSARSRVCMSGGNVTESLRNLDKQFGIVS